MSVEQITANLLAAIGGVAVVAAPITTLGKLSEPDTTRSAAIMVAIFCLISFFAGAYLAVSKLMFGLSAALVSAIFFAIRNFKRRPNYIVMPILSDSIDSEDELLLAYMERQVLKSEANISQATSPDSEK